MGHERTRYSAGNDNRPAVLGVCLASVLAAVAWWAWRHSERVEVSGLSMAPGLQPGDRLVVWRPASWRTTAVHAGDIVAAPHPRHPERTVLKRAGAVGPDGVLLLGDNPSQSTDSRHFGRIPVTSVRGKAIYRYAPSGRAGRLRRT
jgi:nickel-type superoxide dismutase maturation protease